MELGLSLGDTPAPKPFSFTDQSRSQQQKDLGFCMGLGSSNQIQDHKHKNDPRDNNDDDVDKTNCSSSSSDPPPLQLDLLPLPALHQSPPPPPPPPPSHRPLPWLPHILIAEMTQGKGLDVKPLTAIYDPDNHEERVTVQSSPDNSNSDTSSFQMDFSSLFRGSRFPSRKRDLELTAGNLDYLVESSERDSSRRRGSSDEDENGSGRKKLRLTKQQSAFLEDSFKEHNTLNPKQKLILANQLNLRPRQVEVWFQNRRARTKLKQTEVDCEYLKTCCETLTEENRRLQKELQELRALKSSHPFYMQLPPTTLTMCPSCERVVTTSSTVTTTLPQQPTSGCP